MMCRYYKMYIDTFIITLSFRLQAFHSKTFIFISQKSYGNPYIYVGTLVAATFIITYHFSRKISTVGPYIYLNTFFLSRGKFVMETTASRYALVSYRNILYFRLKLTKDPQIFPHTALHGALATK